MIFSAAERAASKLEKLRQAEAKLLAFSKTFGTRSSDAYDVQSFDTAISRSELPLKNAESSVFSCADCRGSSNDDQEELIVHGVQVISKTIYDKSNTTDTPLVLLHGYMNAAGYFYRNLAGLSNYYQSIYSLDLLGWGLSSRPSFDLLKDDSLEAAEDFFVESLELWRKKHNLGRMILAGHSMGGYISVAYCERYPDNVEKLVLLSPIGVPDENDPSFQKRKEKIESSLGSRVAFGVFQTLFENVTVGSFLRTLPESQAQHMAHKYVEKRLPEISDPEERKAVGDYLFYNNILPGSGEYSIQKVLNSNLLSKKPLQHRIPNLKVKNVSFMYGTTDWMDTSAALSTQKLCEAQNDAPTVDVLVVRDAGHLLMLQNWHMTNAVLIHAGGGKVPEGQQPVLMTPGNDSDSEASLGKPFRTDDETGQLSTEVSA